MNFFVTHVTGMLSLLGLIWVWGALLSQITEKNERGSPRSREDNGSTEYNLNGVGSHDQHELGFYALENLNSLRTIAIPRENMDRRHSPAL